MDWTSVVSAVANGVIALSILGTVIGLVLAHNQYRDDVTRRRKQIALEIVHQWIHDVHTREILASVRLAQKLEDIQCCGIVNCQTISIRADNDNVRDANICLAEVIGKDKLKVKKGYIKLRANEVEYLRHLIAFRIDHTESSLLSWKLNIADRETIEVQFRFLCLDADSDDPVDYTLERFRKHFGGETAFPATYEFVKVLKEKLRVSRTPALEG